MVVQAVVAVMAVTLSSTTSPLLEVVEEHKRTLVMLDLVVQAVVEAVALLALVVLLVQLDKVLMVVITLV
jgi:hypothetical protein